MRDFERQFKVAFSEDEEMLMSIIVHVAPKELTATEHFQTLRCFGYIQQSKGLHRAMLGEQESVEAAARIPIWVDKDGKQGG